MRRGRPKKLSPELRFKLEQLVAAAWRDLDDRMIISAFFRITGELVSPEMIGRTRRNLSFVRLFGNRKKVPRIDGDHTMTGIDKKYFIARFFGPFGDTPESEYRAENERLNNLRERRFFFESDSAELDEFNKKQIARLEKIAERLGLKRGIDNTN